MLPSHSSPLTASLTFDPLDANVVHGSVVEDGCIACSVFHRAATHCSQSEVPSGPCLPEESHMTYL